MTKRDWIDKLTAPGAYHPADLELLGRVLRERVPVSMLCDRFDSCEGCPFDVLPGRESAQGQAVGACVLFARGHTTEDESLLSAALMDIGY